jgi:hypothetical protein
MAASRSPDARRSDDFDSHKADVLAYRPGANTGERAGQPGGSKRQGGYRGADSATPPVVLRMPDLSQTESEPPWEPVLRPIRYRLILAALGLTLFLLALCYWVLKADLAPRPDEAPLWDGGNKSLSPGPVKAERPTDGRISTHQPVPTWRLQTVDQGSPQITPLPPVYANQPGAVAGPQDYQAGPRLDIPGHPPLGGVQGQAAPGEEPGVAHLQNRIEVPEAQSDHERPRPRLY